ncbi:MAG: hypothetical protein KC616_26040, partial [Myxococcales bacterium]|nr:hypothetical protein [Myxococcales bacterium]
MAFFCFDSAARALRPLADCNGRDTGDPVGLTGLVTQTARGEVATVDLRVNVVLDADVRVPGYTFVRVGEVPTALVVPPDDPSVTYIADFGSRRVEWVPTDRFRPELVSTATVTAGFVSLPDGPV